MLNPSIGIIVPCSIYDGILTLPPEMAVVLVDTAIASKTTSNKLVRERSIP